MDRCRDICWHFGDGGGLSSCCEGAGPVGQTGICLFGIAVAHCDEESMEDSRDNGGVIVESVR